MTVIWWWACGAKKYDLPVPAEINRTVDGIVEKV